MSYNTKIEQIPLARISVSKKFTKDLYHGDFFLHPKGIPVTKVDMDSFMLWQIKELYLRGDMETRASEDKDSMVSAEDGSINIMQQDIDDMQQAQLLYQEICTFVADSYQTVNKQYRFPIGEPLDTIKYFSERVKRMSSSILRFHELQTERGYIIRHAVNSFILAIALANAAKMPLYRLLNLALSAMFHEVGLLKFIDLLERDKNFNHDELQLQRANVSASINLLKAYEFSPEVMEGILQHHERLDGSGAPHGVSADEITDFGRYLGLVCAYVTMTAEHKFKESYPAHTAIMTLIKGAKIHYDADLVRVLVRLLSLYPVGSYVELSNGAIGRVFRNNQKDPRLPMIRVILDANYKPIAKNTVIQTDKKIGVSRPIHYKKIAPLIARLQKK